ncbi:uncharacterized protein LOC135938360 [Cloeon dipterum]|uniref:uncharacterized protein LOC135938360 n=1 Tax=Cloeon dipterum TaxID=197152 RepID=UPI0032208B44
MQPAPIAHISLTIKTCNNQKSLKDFTEFLYSNVCQNSPQKNYEGLLKVLHRDLARYIQGLFLQPVLITTGAARSRLFSNACPSRVGRGGGSEAAAPKCPAICTHGDKQCPPLVPPVVRQSRPNEPNQVPAAALFAYRLFLFGAKVGVGAFCVKWTLDNSVWGPSSETRALWDQWGPGALITLSGADAPCRASTWNRAVVAAFDGVQRAATAVGRLAADAERAAYESSATCVPGPWHFRTRTTHPEHEAPFVEAVADGQCHLAAVIIQPGNPEIHRDESRPLPEVPTKEETNLPTTDEAELVAMEEAEEAVKQRIIKKEAKEVRVTCCQQAHQAHPESEKTT